MIYLDWVVHFDYEAKMPKEAEAPREGTVVRFDKGPDSVIKYTSRFELHKLVQGKDETDIAKVLARTDAPSFDEDPAAFLRDVLNGSVDFRSLHSSPNEIYLGILANVATRVEQIERNGGMVCINKQKRIIVDNYKREIYVASREKGVEQYYITGKKENEKVFWPQSNGSVRLRVF